MPQLPKAAVHFEKYVFKNKKVKVKVHLVNIQTSPGSEMDVRCLGTVLLVHSPGPLAFSPGCPALKKREEPSSEPSWQLLTRWPGQNNSAAQGSLLTTEDSIKLYHAEINAHGNEHTHTNTDSVLPRGVKRACSS